MVHAEQRVVVDRPIAEVYGFLAEVENDRKWRPEVTELHLVSGSGVGARYAQTMNGPGGRTIHADFVITRADPPTRFDFAVDAGPLRPTGSLQLAEVTATSTEVRFVVDVVPTGMFVLMKGMVQKLATAEAENIRRLPGAIARG